MEYPKVSMKNVGKKEFETFIKKHRKRIHFHGEFDGPTRYFSDWELLCAVDWGNGRYTIDDNFDDVLELHDINRQFLRENEELCRSKQWEFAGQFEKYEEWYNPLFEDYYKTHRSRKGGF